MSASGHAAKAAPADDSPAHPADPADLAHRASAICERLSAADPSGMFSVWIGPATSRRAAWAYRENEPHVAASTMKLAVGAALLRAVNTGDLSLDQRVRVHAEFESSAPGQRFTVDRDADDAAQTWQHLGHDVTLGWLAEQMVSHSSNLATDLVLEQVGLAAAAAVTDAVAGPPDRIVRLIDDRPATATGLRNLVTAAGMARLLAATYARELAGRSTGILGDWLAGNSWNDQIPALLPEVRVEHKNGWDDGIRHDCGIVYPEDAPAFIICVLTTSTLPDQQAKAAIAALAKAAYDQRGELNRYARASATADSSGPVGHPPERAGKERT